MVNALSFQAKALQNELAQMQKSLQDRMQRYSQLDLNRE